MSKFLYINDLMFSTFHNVINCEELISYMPKFSTGVTGNMIKRMVILRKDKHYSHRKIARELNMNYKEYMNVYKSLRSLGIYQFVYNKLEKLI